MTTTMSTVRLLLLEDNPSDAELILATLAEEGVEYVAETVETRVAFLAALDRKNFDLVLSDCALPSFDGLTALKLCREKFPHVPFIFVSGTMGEERAIETLKSGATDYVLKDRLSRLGPAVRRAVAEAEGRGARQEAERSRSEAESLFRTLFDQVAVGVAIAEANGRIVKTNPALQSMLGYGEEALANAELAHITHPEDARTDAEPYRRLCKGEQTSYQIEKRLVRRDGTVFPVRMVVCLIRPNGQAARLSIHLIEDITERKKLEQSFVEAEKMEVVGRLAAGCAHDFNNLLTIINGYTQILLRRVPPEAQTELREILEAGERATALTQRLLAYSRKQAHHPARLDLAALIRGLDNMLQRLVGDQICLEMRLDPEGGYVVADQTQVEQLIMNLVANARDAMPEGGDLIIATECAQPEDSGAGPESVVLSITDTGCGMDAETLRHIFEPFFTTKEVGKGTGLGLWMVHEIVNQSRGSIAVDSEPGRGTSITICWPVAEGTESGLGALAASVRETATAGTGPATILVAEDDEALRELAREILEPEGYRVLTARDGAEALAILERKDEDVHLLITDMTMPNMSGADLSARLARLRPDLKILFVSGLPESAFPATLGSSQTGFLQKPFTFSKLLNSVQQLLAVPVEAGIVVLDDDPAIRSFLGLVLHQSGYRVMEASSSRQAVLHLRQNKVDLLITDVIMPYQDGLETIQAVRKEFPQLRVVAMSGGFGEEYLEVARHLGAQDVIRKPFTADGVVDTIRRILLTSPGEAAGRSEMPAER